jgi:hypothetical protein
MHNMHIMHTSYDELILLASSSMHTVIIYIRARMHITCGTRIHGEEIPKPLTLIDSLCHVIIHESMIHAMHTRVLCIVRAYACMLCIL